MADRAREKNLSYCGNTNYQPRWRQISKNRRPPPPGGGQRSVPAWEKRFCASIGLVPWQKLLEAQKFMHLYENVISWEDSACKEAFKNAKSRFWAEMKGLPCDLKLPDPDIYIDKIDWDVDIDPDLLLDLETEPTMRNETSTQQDEGNILILGKPLASNELPHSCNTGWGNLEEEPKGGASGLLSSHLDPKASNLYKDQRKGWGNSNQLSWDDDAGCAWGVWTANEDWDGPKRDWNDWDDDRWRDLNQQSGVNDAFGGGQWEAWNANNKQDMSTGWNSIRSSSFNRSNMYAVNDWVINNETDGANAGQRRASWRRENFAGQRTSGWYNDNRRPTDRRDAYQFNRGWKNGNQGSRKRSDSGYEQPSWVDKKLASSRCW